MYCIQHHRKPNTQSFFEGSEEYTLCLEFTSAQVNLFLVLLLSQFVPINKDNPKNNNHAWISE